MKYLKSLYCWVLIAFFGGSALGILNPSVAVLMGPLGTNFIKLIKIFIGPIVFLTVSTGIAQTGSLKKLGKIGLKAFIYFEVISTLALFTGWLIASVLKPGSIMQVNIDTLDLNPVMQFIQHKKDLSFIDFLQNIIPTSIIDAFMNGDMLQILFLAILFGIALLNLRDKQAHYLLNLMDQLTQSLFHIIRMIMYAAPIGVFGAMAFSIGKFGNHFLIPLVGLVGAFYLTSFLFLVVVLGGVCKLLGFSLFRFLNYLSPELLLVLGTSSSEAALPQLLKKLERLGCERETIGVVVPMGYSFNLDGTNIYITLASLFIAQAFGIHLSLTQQLALFATAMLASKGAAGVAGSGFVTLAATLSIIPSIPVAGIVLILGIDRFMSDGRALINFIGNGVAALAISCWEKELNMEKLNKMLDYKKTPPTVIPSPSLKVETQKGS